MIYVTENKFDQNNSAFPILLARAGYDVWLGNFRGSINSLEHETLTSESGTGYWDFSWAEIGLYDLPAMVGHIHGLTNEHDVTYIGNS